MENMAKPSETTNIAANHHGAIHWPCAIIFTNLLGELSRVKKQIYTPYAC